MTPRRLALTLTLLCAGLSAAAQMQEPHAEARPFIAGYHVDGKYLILGPSMRTESGALPPFEAMAAQQVGEVYHEMWHAWFLEVETPRKGEVYRRLQSEADVVHAQFRADKRLEMHEEAAADFIDALVVTYVQMKRFLEGKTSERRAEILTETRYPKLWSDLFREQWVGYYVRSIKPVGDASTTAALQVTSATLRSAPKLPEAPQIMVDIRDACETLKPFIADARAFGLPVEFLEEALPHLNGVAFVDLTHTEGPQTELRADAVFAHKGLKQEDLTLIEKSVLHGRLPRDPLAAFAEERFSKSSETPPAASD